MRVKTTSNNAPIWTAKKDDLFLNRQGKDDLVIICNIANGIRGADIYVVLTDVAEEHLTKNHTDYVAHRGKNGKARNADTNIRVLRFFGDHRADNPSFGYHEKFLVYRDNWDLLK